MTIGEEQGQAIATIRQSLAGAKPPIKILLVEDNARDAEDTIARLEKYDVEVHLARTSVETQNYLRDNEPRLVFLDMKLETISGLVVLDFIRLLRPECKVLVLTGAYDHNSAECIEALAKGAKMILKKPLAVDVIQLLFCAL